MSVEPLRTVSTKLVAKKLTIPNDPRIKLAVEAPQQNDIRLGLSVETTDVDMDINFHH